VKNSPGHNESFSRPKFDSAPFEVDDQLSLNDIEEFVIGIMFVPMIFTLNHAEADNGVVHLTKSLVVPLMAGGIGKRLLIDNL
jgi:hypothetical protein